MHSIPHDISQHDLLQWIDKCWVVLDTGPTASSRVVALAKRNSDGNVVYHTPQAVMEQPISNVYVHWPLLGYVNLPEAKIAIHLERQAHKQWTRTYNHRYVTLSVPRGFALLEKDDVVNSLTSDSYHVVSSAFFPKYYPIFVIFHQLFPSGWRSAAITRHTLVTNEEIPLVYHRGIRVAHIRDGVVYKNTELKLTHRMWKLFEGFHIEETSYAS